MSAECTAIITAIITATDMGMATVAATDTAMDDEGAEEVDAEAGEGAEAACFWILIAAVMQTGNQPNGYQIPSTTTTRYCPPHPAADSAAWADSAALSGMKWTSQKRPRKATTTRPS